MRRVHRSFAERFRYMAIFKCRECAAVESAPRQYVFHLGPQCRCPRCGTLRVVRLRSRDHIDPMRHGLLNLLERMAGGRLYHCRYCRIQFFDRRPLAPEQRTPAAQPYGEPATAPSDTASSDA